MGNTQSNEGKTKMGKSPGKVKTLIKMRGKRGKTEDVPFLEIVPDDEHKKQKNILEVSRIDDIPEEQVHKGEVQVSPANEESSSDSVFTDPLTPVGLSTEINTCYYSDENIDTNIVVSNIVKDTFLELPLNNFKLNEFKIRKEEEFKKKLNKLGLSKTSQISLECNPRYCFTSENVECVEEDNKNDSPLLDSVQSCGLSEYKRQTSEPSTSPERSLVLKRVVSLTLDKETLETKVCKPKFVPEKLDFKLYEKFEGHMLINWYLSEFYDNDHLKKLVQNQDLKLLATQFCTHLLAAGVLHQIPDKDVPMYNTFKPDLMYYWAHSETPASVPQTPGRLNSLYWPPTSPCASNVFTPISNINSEVSTHLKTPLIEHEQNSTKDCEELLLEEEKDRLKREIEKYKTLIEIQTLTTNAVNDFDSSDVTKHFICNQCGLNSNYVKKNAQLSNADTHKYTDMSTANNSFNDKLEEKTLLTETLVLTDTLTQCKSESNASSTLALAFKNDETSSTTNSYPIDTITVLNKLSPELDNITQSQATIDLKSSISSSSSNVIEYPVVVSVPPSFPSDTCTTSTLSASFIDQTSIAQTAHLSPSGIPAPPPPPFACGGLPSLSSILLCSEIPIPPPPPPPPSSLTPITFGGIPPPPPPLLLKGILPSPPQHGGLPLPLPTPPIGGWISTKSMLNKEAVTPKMPMKPLYWTRIIVPTSTYIESSSKPIWSQVEELELENISEFSNLFSRQVIQKAATKKKVETVTKIKPVKMLDSKRSQNVGILAQSLHVDFSEIENAIYTFDTSVVSLEALQQIYEVRATSEELKQIQQHLKQKPDIPLDKPEQFLFDLSEISNFPERISCFMFQIEFSDSITNIENTLTNMKSTCDFLTDNQSLIKILSIILTLGNYMNGGNLTRGQADGFNIEILSKLKDVKSNDAQVTLLHFIVRTYMDQFDYIVLMEMSLPVPDPEDIRKAASVNFEEVSANLHLLEKNLKACENKIEKVLETATTDNIEPFQGKMKNFIDNVKEQLKTEIENLENCKTKFASTMRMYQFKSKAEIIEETPPNDFFDLWYLFCKDFKDIWKKELIRREKEKKYELKLKEALRKSEIIRVDIKPNSIKEKVKKLVQEEMN